MAAFEPFDGRGKHFGRRQAEPAVTVHASGVLSLNGLAVAALGGPAAVLLLHDPDGPKIGFSPAEPSHPNAYRLRANGQRDTARAVSGIAFFGRHRIPIPAARRFPVHVEAGVLYIDLSEDSVPAPGPRSRQHGSAANGH